jgi:hypothetical protein
MFSAVPLPSSTPLSIPEPHLDPLPLYKRLRVDDSVLARHSDGRYYEAIVHGVIHGGYPSAQYEVKYANSRDSVTHLVSWKDLEDLGEGRGEKRGRDMVALSTSNDDKDVFGRDRRVPVAVTATAPVREVIEHLSSDINPSLLNRPKGAWRKK